MTLLFSVFGLLGLEPVPLGWMLMPRFTWWKMLPLSPGTTRWCWGELMFAVVRKYKKDLKAIITSIIEYHIPGRFQLIESGYKSWRLSMAKCTISTCQGKYLFWISAHPATPGQCSYNEYAGSGMMRQQGRGLVPHPYMSRPREIKFIPMAATQDSLTL